MHFITESELRTAFRNEAFRQFSLKETERLTPGAKQFLLDNKVDIVELKKAVSQTTSSCKTVTTLIGYQELLSAELLETAVLAMKDHLNISQTLLTMEKKVSEMLTTATPDAEPTEISLDAKTFKLEAVHIFSEQGMLLIQLKKIYGLICLILAIYPQTSQHLSEVVQELGKLVKQLVGNDDE